MPNDGYLLARSVVETGRLDMQHNWVKHILNRNSPIPTSVDTSTLSNIMDIGAGTLVWTLDVASLPEIAPRLSSTAENPVRLYACDVSAAQFPPKESLDKLEIVAFEHDAKVPFEEELKGKFDLVYIRFLAPAINKEGWSSVLDNIHDLLAPGGLLVHTEINNIMYQPDRKYASDARADPSEYYDQPIWLDEFNYTISKGAEKAGFYRDPVYRVPTFMSESKWKIESYNIYPGPIGALCRTMKGAGGQPFDEWEEFTARSMTGVYEALTSNYLRLGALHGRERDLNTEEDRKAFVAEFFKNAREHGIYATVGETVAKKL